MQRRGPHALTAMSTRILGLTRAEARQYLATIGIVASNAQTAPVLHQRLFIALGLGSIPDDEHPVASPRVALPELFNVQAPPTVYRTRADLIVALHEEQRRLLPASPSPSVASALTKTLIASPSGSAEWKCR
jgi:hypothetical protein